jgi:hypothetical protein
LVGNCFAYAAAQYSLNPPESDHVKAIETLKKLIKLPVANLYLGHYGICQRPKEVMARAIKNMQNLLDIGRKYVSEGTPEKITDEVYKMLIPELEKLRLAGRTDLYEYAIKLHMPSQAVGFAKFCERRFAIVRK